MEKRIEELNLKDDFLFTKVMSDMEICRKVLEKILGISIKRVELAASQKTIDILLLLQARSIQLFVRPTLFLSVPLTHFMKTGIFTAFGTPVRKILICYWGMKQKRIF